MLHYIRTNLGMGRVYLYQDGYYRYQVFKPEQLKSLIEIYRGKLVFKKTLKRYNELIASYNRNQNVLLPLEPEENVMKITKSILNSS